MTDQRRLSDSEVSAVLARAAEVSESSGLTVAQVHEIARDVGLSPDAVTRALEESASGALRPATLERSAGLPVGVAKEVLLPGVLGDEAWSVLVSTMRATFAARGTEHRDGSVREWRNGALRIAVEPIDGGHRLRMSTRKSSALVAPLIGGLGAFMSAATLAAGGTVRPGLALVAAIPAAIGAVLLASPFISLPRWARERSDHFDRIAREAISLAKAATDRRLPSSAPSRPPATTDG
ncbi:MAG: hypothetical protein IT355_13995 [Gemmatimonadaceae bacterium]|nr:hypothetical protein [Gemmatimonadaceae bacterium]